ncbi:MAG: hypothetical protein COV44_03300 [Deltaproteobacteria bacterium CG11_big_fil_rev_8_21_14_0_20_45_16]|nr:MAG: hypothetical protein COV44_03300 [Deltaproteobacteria bacterium CG11_big_fil_rev_8_21_14_0_20_45_16]
MRIELDISGQRLEFLRHEAIHIGVPISFEEDRPAAFGVPNSSRKKISNDSFVGDTSKGGSCNVEEIYFIPHCHGTHTESIGHLVNNAITISELSFQLQFLKTCVISIPVVEARKSKEHYTSNSSGNDLWLTAEAIQKSWENLDHLFPPEALVIRSLPNPANKPLSQNSNAAYFTEEAMRWLINRDIEHLVVDIPSIDRMEDGGKLINHRAFWNLLPDQKTINKDSWRTKTLTEFAYIPDRAKDGCYIMNINPIDWHLDAVPSSPILFPVEREER